MARNRPRVGVKAGSTTSCANWSSPSLMKPCARRRGAKDDGTWQKCDAPIRLDCGALAQWLPPRLRDGGREGRRQAGRQRFVPPGRAKCFCRRFFSQAMLTEPATKMPSARMTKKSTASVATTVFSAFCSAVSGPPPYTWSRMGEMTVGPCFPLSLPLLPPLPPLPPLRRRSCRERTVGTWWWAAGVVKKAWKLQQSRSAYQARQAASNAQMSEAESNAAGARLGGAPAARQPLRLPTLLPPLPPHRCCCSPPPLVQQVVPLAALNRMQNE